MAGARESGGRGPRRGAGALLCVLALSAAAPAGALTLEEALAEAALANPTLRAAREQARAGHEGLAIARSEWLPTIDLNASWFRNRAEFANSFFDSSGERRSAGLTWTQNLYRGGASTAALRLAEANVARGHAQVEDTEQSVFLQVATAYLDVLRAGHTVRLRRESLAAFDERVRDAAAQFRVGDRTQADVSQAEAERDLALAEVAAAEADLDVQRALFRTLVGGPPDGLEAAREPSGLPESLDAAQEAARRDRPAARAAQLAVRSAELAVRSVAAEAGPRVDLRAGYTREKADSAFSPTSDANVNLQLAMPLYRAGATGARLREARRTLAQRRDQLAAAENDAAHRAASAWRGLESARERHAALEAAAAASRAALRAIRREAEIGERTTREVLDAERRLVEQRIRVLSARRDAIVEAYRLMEAVGALTARRLGIAGLPDLAREAGEAEWNLYPSVPLLDWAPFAAE